MDRITITSTVGRRGTFNIVLNNDELIWDGLRKGMYQLCKYSIGSVLIHILINHITYDNNVFRSTT